MSVRVARLALTAVTLAAIPGMVVSLAGDHQRAALAFGLVAGVAALGLILVTAVAAEPAGEKDAEEQAAGVEARVVALVARGADEQEVRQLVAEAVKLGRRRR
jgi:hypothetical protein